MSPLLLTSRSGDYYKIDDDIKRDKYIEGLGFTLIRFKNRFVFQEPEGVKYEIRKVYTFQESQL